MAHSIKELGTDRRGNFVRNLGWKLADGGRRTQPRFYLGKDRHEARRRNERLQELWGVIENEADVSQAAIWSATTLEIAKAIAEGRSSCELSPPLPINDGDDVLAYTKLVDDYAKKFRMIAILPGDMNAYQQGQALFGDRKKEVVRLGAKVFGEPNILEAETRTLHEALDDYIEFVKAAFIDIESRKTSG